MGPTQSTSASHVLRTPLGSLRGIQLSDLESGKPVYQRYTRIPYALPPTGERRWRRPQLLAKDFTFDDQVGNPGDYSDFGPICPQLDYGGVSAVNVENPKRAPEPSRIQSEDCLYLNIWVPAGTPPSGGWPVQFFIHGGWLQIGDAMQTLSQDPFDLFASTDTPRVVVSATHRLNIFGFLTDGELAQLKEEPAAGNFGFWDQRAALQWTYDHIEFFSGNKDNITVGGLSAGGYSTFFQLHYDTYLPASQRIIKRAFLWSNSVGVQPNPIDSEIGTAQFHELLEHFQIPLSDTPAEKMRRLRNIPSQDLVDALAFMKLHAFRASSDDSFVSSRSLQSIRDGSFTSLLRDHGVSILLGEVADEELLYRLVNPAASLPTLITQLNNYYPPTVTNAMIKLFPLPKEGAQKKEWGDIFGTIAGDCQVYATIRGFSKSVLDPDAGTKGLSISNVHRYRIAWRAKSLDEWIDPNVGVCHGMDMAVWWCLGYRAGFTDQDKEHVQTFLKPFGQFLKGEKVDWGTENEKQIREMGADGVTRIVEDSKWARGLEVWRAMLIAQSR